MKAHIIMGITVNKVYKRKSLFLRLLFIKEGDVQLIDIHTHILYGVDDGAQKLIDTIDLLEEAEKVGFTKIILTSHYMEGYFTVNSLKRQEVLKEINHAKTVNIDLYLGNEIFLTNNIVTFLRGKQAVPLNNTRYVLFELPFNIKPIKWMDMIFQMQANHLVPILAHPERYSYFYKTPEVYEELVGKGVLLQLNFGSFGGQYGQRAKFMAEKLLKSNLAHFIATDVHKPGTVYPEIPNLVTYLNKLVGEEKVNQLTTINPELLLEDKKIEIENFSNIKWNLREKLKMR